MSKLLIDEKPLQVLPTLAVAIGLNEALALQQVHFWIRGAKEQDASHKHQDGRWWVYNTYEEWRKTNFPFWSIHTIQRVFLALEKRGLLISEQLEKAKYNRRKWYTIDYDKFAELEKSLSSCQIGTMDDSQDGAMDTTQDGSFSTEITTENTTETLGAEKPAPEPTPEKPPTPSWNECKAAFIETEWVGERRVNHFLRMNFGKATGEYAKGNLKYPMSAEEIRGFPAWYRLSKKLGGAGMERNSWLPRYPDKFGEYCDLYQAYLAKKAATLATPPALQFDPDAVFDITPRVWWPRPAGVPA